MGMRKQEREERIRYVLENKDTLTREMLVMKWDTTTGNVVRFLRNNNLPAIGRANKVVTPVIKPKEEQRIARINYVIKNHHNLSLLGLSKTWGIQLKSVLAFLSANNLPLLPVRKSTDRFDGVRIADEERTYMGKYRSINDVAAMIRLI